MKLTNDLVATEIMGWEIVLDEFEVKKYQDQSRNYVKYFPEQQRAYLASEIFNPSEDMNHAAMMEKRIEELGLKYEYTHRLTDILDDGKQGEGDLLFKHVTASPEQRCRAALVAKGVDIE